MEYAWTGSWPENRSPVSGEIIVGGLQQWENAVFSAGSTTLAFVEAWDRENDSLQYTWTVYPESTSKASGGDPETPEIPVGGLVEQTTGNTAVLNMPSVEGAYRLYVYVSDKNNRVSISNYPFYVE